MPVWEVSEPYINLWLYDEPIFYQPGLGPRISFKATYKQRESRTIYTNVFSLGAMWDSSWISYVTFDPNNPSFQTMFLAGGGERSYATATHEFFSNTLLDTTLNGTNLAACTVTYPDGAKDYYGYVIPLDMKQAAFLTAKVDANGHTNSFVYQQVSGRTLLKYVIDVDGRTNTLTYTNASFPAQITGVQDPFNRLAVLKYDDKGVLTNITDPAGISSSFKYDSKTWLTNLTTPYGLTTFEHFMDTYNPTNEFTDTNSFTLIRACRVVDAMGGTNVYMLRQDSSQITTNGTTYVNCLDSTWTNTVPAFWGTGPDVAFMNFRNSFHWGPRQASTLPSNVFRFGPSDIQKARWTHWLHDGQTDPKFISQIPQVETDISPDGINYGQTTWYSYDGQPNAFTTGTQSQPGLIERKLDDGTTWYARYLRDDWGRVTTAIETYSTNFGAAPLTRTNQYIYSATGDLLQEIGPRGETLAGYFYDGNHNLLRMTNAVGYVAYFTYDSVGRLTTSKSFSGLTTMNIYFASGDYTNWVQTQIDLEINRTNTFTYTNDLVATRTDERGVTTTYTYDNLRRVLTEIDARGTNSYTYTNLDLTRVVDRLGLTNSFGYDALRRMTAQTNALGYFTLYNYCSCGSLDSVRDAAGNLTSFSYDNAGRRTQAIYPDNFVVNYQYNLLGQLTNVNTSGGYSVTNWFNNQGLVYASSNAMGQVQFIAFDNEDRVVTNIDANGVSLALTYDNLGRVLTRTYPDNGIERFGYSTNGLTAYTNQLGMTNFFTYDAAGRKTWETNANGEKTQFQYDPSGNLTNLIDGKSQNTSWNYDQYSRVTNKVDAALNVLFIYGYDADNRVTNRWTPSKGTTTYRYDGAGNLTNVLYQVNAPITLGYDPLNRLTSMVDGVGTTLYGYDAVGQVLSEDGPWPSDTVSYTYANRLRTGLTLQMPSASAWAEGFGYDNARRLTSLTSPAGVFGYAYDLTRSLQVAKLTLPNGAYITNTFDNAARLLSTTLKNSGNGVLNSHSYSYNLASQRTALTNTAGDYRNYTYDPIGQLTGTTAWESGGTTSRFNESLTCTYDAAGNVATRRLNTLTETFSVNPLNEISNVTRSGLFTVTGSTTAPATNVTVNGSTATLYSDGTFAKSALSLASGNNTFTAIGKDSSGRADTNVVSAYLPTSAAYVYDLNGNLLSDGTRSFAFDDENQLISVVVSNGVTTSTRSDFAYDGKMRCRVRFESTWGGTTWVTNQIVRYVYDGNLVVQERDGNNTPLVSYTRGKDLSGSFQGAGGIGGLLGRTDHLALSAQQPAAQAYYHADGSGNVTALINTNQYLVAKYLYDPFGSVLSRSGPLADANVYRFSSKEFHTASGLFYYLYRLYDPNLQRWITRDPIGELADNNLYRAGYSSLNNYFDADGRAPQLASVTLDGGNGTVSGNYVDHQFGEGYGIGAHGPIDTGPVGAGLGILARVQQPIDNAETWLKDSGNPFVRGLGGLLAGIQWALPEGELSRLGKVSKCDKLLNQFNSADSLIQNAGALTRLKGGKLMGTVTGDGEAIFKAVSQGGQTLPSGFVKMADGTIIGKHIATSTGEFTIDINKAGRSFKIRVNP
jgi:RHS repeat-associated protein